MVADFGMTGSSVEAVLSHEPTVEELTAIEGVQHDDHGRVIASGLRSGVSYGGLDVHAHDVDGEPAESELIHSGWQSD